MPSDTSNIRAILVGIDRYPELPPEAQLKGCVNDVNEVSHFLRSYLNVPPENITILSSPEYPKVDTKSPSAPTKENVMNALKPKGNEKPDSFVYFHYSGHGNQYETKHEDMKGQGAKDEVLCTLNGEITDVELGNTLDDLAENQTVLAVLDCCHSGGADRYGKHDNPHQGHLKIRCPTDAGHGRHPVKIDPGLGASENHPHEQTQGGFRNAVLFKSGLYRERKYNLLAACQPSMKASEAMVKTWQEEQKILGALTHHLLSLLSSLRGSHHLITYRNLLERLKAAFNNRQTRIQDPMHLGNENRILFCSKSMKAGTQNLITSVKAVSGTSVTLCAGRAGGVSCEDWFQLYPPSQLCLGLITADDSASIPAQISEVRDHEAEAELFHNRQGSSQGVAAGWLAKLSARAMRHKIRVCQPSPQSQDAITRLQETWESHDDSIMPLELVFNSDSEEAIFSVDVDEDMEFQISDNLRQPIAPIPCISVQKQDSVRHLMALLRHLCLYHHVADIRTKGRDRPFSYDFSIEEIRAKKGNQLGLWRVKFENTSTIPLFITILNLGPAYGIGRVYPFDDSYSQRVEANSKISYDTLVEIVVPTILQSPSKRSKPEMRDVIKLFVSSKVLHLDHYALEDLEKDPLCLHRGPMRGRTIDPRTFASSWVVEKKIIDTPIPEGTHEGIQK